MSPLAGLLRQALAALAGRAEIALVGGLAVSVRTEPRFTRDVDLAVAAADDAQAEAVIHALVTAGFLTDALLEQTQHGRLATMRLRRQPRGPLVDLLFASCGIETEVVAAAEHMVVLSHGVRVARTGHLIAMKLLARDDKRRPQDLVDLRALAAAADDAEWERAEAAARLIEERGFARGRDLARALAELRSSPSA